MLVRVYFFLHHEGKGGKRDRWATMRLNALFTAKIKLIAFFLFLPLFFLSTCVLFIDLGPS